MGFNRQPRRAPHQDNRLNESLRSATIGAERDQRRHPLFDGNGQTVKDVAIAAGNTALKHILKRRPRGVLIYNVRGSAAGGEPNIYELANLRSTTNVTLYYNSGGGGVTFTVDVYIF